MIAHDSVIGKIVLLATLYRISGAVSCCEPGEAEPGLLVRLAVAEVR